MEDSEDDDVDVNSKFSTREFEGRYQDYQDDVFRMTNLRGGMRAADRETAE
jgi:hypothetical protein